MRLQVKIGLHLGSIISQDFVHRDFIGTQMFRTLDNLHSWKMFSQSGDHFKAVSIYHNLGNLGDNQQGADDMVKERLHLLEDDNFSLAHVESDAA